MNSIDPMQASLIFIIATTLFVLVMVTALYKAVHGYDLPHRRVPRHHA